MFLASSCKKLTRHASNSILVSIISLTILLFYVFSSSSFHVELKFFGLLSFGLLNFLLYFPIVLIKWLKREKTVSHPSAQGLVLLSIYALTAINQTLFPIPIALTGIGLFIVFFWTQCTHTIRAHLLPISFSILLGIWISFEVFKGPYHALFFLERIPFQNYISSGSGVIDTLYHSSITNMILLYQTVSLGLNGTVPHSYHIGSHVYYAQICKLLNCDALSFYLISFVLLIIPFFIKSLLTLNTEIDFAYSKNATSATRLNITFLAGVSGILPPIIAERSAVWKNFFISESHCLGLIFLLISLACIVSISANARTQNKEKFWFDLVCILLLIPVSLFTKISSGTIGFLFLFFFILRYQEISKKILWGIIFSGLVLALVIVYSQFNYLSTYKGAFDIKLFGFHQAWLSGHFVVLHFLITYFWTSLVFIIEFQKNAISSKTEFFEALKKRKFVLSESILFISSVASIPAVLNIAGANAIYFLETQYLLAFIAGYTLLESVVNNSIKSRLVLIFSLLFAFNLIQTYFQFSAERKSVTSAITKYGSNHQIMREAKLLKELRHISLLPYEEKKGLLLYVDPSLRQYWSLFDNWQFSKDTCYFFGPAVAGIPLLKGIAIPPKSPELYGLEKYRNVFGFTKRLNAAEVTKEAESMGFKRVIILD